MGVQVKITVSVYKKKSNDKNNIASMLNFKFNTT